MGDIEKEYDGWMNSVTFTPPDHMYRMSRRDYFAVMAMQGIIASNTPGLICDGEVIKNIEEAAVLMADSLIKELDKK